MKNISKLKPYPNNPRIHGDGKGLNASILKYGDLSGVVNNIRLNKLVGGHYRSNVIPPDSIIESHPVTDSTGTVAEGTIILPTGQRLNYREVDWNEQKHKEACIVANNQKIQGEWDVELLGSELQEISIDMPEIEFEELGLNLLAEDLILQTDGNKNGKGGNNDLLEKEFKLEIDCESEHHQQSLYNELSKRGLKCRVLTL